jgi:hypothetical protein
LLEVIGKIAGLLVFFGAAVVAAMILAYFAHDELGQPVRAFEHLRMRGGDLTRRSRDGWTSYALFHVFGCLRESAILPVWLTPD